VVQSLLAPVLSAFGNQTKRQVERPVYQSSLPALAAADKKHLAKLRKEASSERFYNLISQPEILGFVMAFGGLLAANNIPFSDDEEKNILLQGIASTLSVAMGMGYAGVGDLTSLSVALAAGAGSLGGSILGSSGNTGEWYRYLNPIGFLISELT